MLNSALKSAQAVYNSWLNKLQNIHLQIVSLNFLMPVT